jgi:hypothetical protein
VKWVKCATCWTLRSASNEPCSDDSMYMKPPNIMKRSVGE